MREIFENIPKIVYKGPGSRDPLSFRFYDADRVVLGRKMSVWLPFSMSWWHTLCAEGSDMFGDPSADRSFGEERGTEAHARAKADAGIELMQKLGIRHYCFHDTDLIPEAGDIRETNRRLDLISDYILERTEGTGIKCLWGTANLFRNPRYMCGAMSSCSADVCAFAAAQTKKAIDITVKLGGRGYVFWGGREGYDTLLNTDMKFETDNTGYIMRLAADYGRRMGFTGDFYIEPKPREPMKHQYDYDAAAAIGFIRSQGLEKDFRLNIEANHATLAGHTFWHELRVAAINGMLGSVDANQGDMLLGWDTDEFPSDVYTATYAMLEIVRAGGLTGGINFDAKTGRTSNTYEDIFKGYILGMDTYALGLINAEKIIRDGRTEAFLKERYSSFGSGIGEKIAGRRTSLEELSAYAEGLGAPGLPRSGNLEGLAETVNDVLFGGE